MSSIQDNINDHVITQCVIDCVTMNYSVTKYVFIMLLLLIYSFMVTIRLFREH